LSPRTVHFHTSELIWECKETFDCECGEIYFGDPFAHNGFSCIGKWWFNNMETSKSKTEIMESWMHVVQQYSRLKLSHSEDKLTALSGLASRFALKAKSDYLAGLWKDDLPRSLCWFLRNFEPDFQVTKGRRCDPYRAPSWSWASVEILGSKINPFAGGISYGMVIDKGFVPDTCLKILEAECTTTAESPYGQVTRSRLRVHGALVSVGQLLFE
jgi:hypothetical protein